MSLKSKFEPMIATTPTGRMCFCLEKIKKKQGLLKFFTELQRLLKDFSSTITISLISGGVGCALTYLMWIR